MSNTPKIAETLGRVGWLPDLRVVTAPGSVFIQLAQWTGRTGTPPTDFVGYYMGLGGWVESQSDAYNFVTDIAEIVRRNVDNSNSSAAVANVVAKIERFANTDHPDENIPLDKLVKLFDIAGDAPIDDFADETIPLRGRYHHATLNHPQEQGGGSGYYIKIINTDGSSQDPIRFLVFPNGNGVYPYWGYSFAGILRWTSSEPGTGPQGEKGDKGDKGDAGDRGADGARGSGRC